MKLAPLEHRGCTPRRHQQGAALAVGLILLLILTLLAVSGVGTATMELVMAGNEQFRKNASQAATAGIEIAVPLVKTVPTVPGSQVTVDDVPLPGAGDPADATDSYSTVTRYVGEEAGLPQSSVDEFVGLHYVIQSTGRSSREARDTQVQGVLVIDRAVGSETAFGQLGTGLSP